MIELGINIDHVATVRQARRTFEPDPVVAAALAEQGGADGITFHLREDRRHIQERNLAADVRALTPTDGATCVLPDRDLVVRSLNDMRARLDRTARNAINTRQNRLNALQTRSILKRPHELVQRRFRQLDELDARGRKAMFTRMELNKAKLAKAAATLSALSPLNVLARGYSVTLDSNDNTIQKPNQVKPGDIIRSRVEHGDIESEVKAIITYDE